MTGRLGGGCSVEPLLALAARLKRTVMVRAPLPLRLSAPTPRVKPRVVGSAKHQRAVGVARELRSALSQRLHVMDVEGAPAVSCQVREGALSVVREDARAEVPPARGFVNRGHDVSPQKMLPDRAACKPLFGPVFPKFLHEVLHSVTSVLCDVGG